jgi:hypothetical protein
MSLVATNPQLACQQIEDLLAAGEIEAAKELRTELYETLGYEETRAFTTEHGFKLSGAELPDPRTHNIYDRDRVPGGFCS